MGRVRAILLGTDETAGLLPRMREGEYDRFRKFVKGEIVADALNAGTPQQQIKRMKGYLDALRRKMDVASVGEYFAEFWRKVFGAGENFELQGQLKGAYEIEGASRRIDGSRKMIDGVMQVPASTKRPNGPTIGGRYAIEDKAGKSFSLDQARNYSEHLKNSDNIPTSGGDPCIGLIYICESRQHAETIAAKLDDEGLSDKIFIAAFGDPPGGPLEFVERDLAAAAAAAAGPGK